MSTQWYYTHDRSKHGPYSDRQLRDLADSGQIVAADTVWKEGVERGVPAGRVKNLFPAAVGSPPPAADAGPNGTVAAPAVTPAAAAPAADMPSSGETPALVADESAPAAGPPATPATEPTAASAPARDRPSWQPPPASKARAVAGKGAVVVGQDGTNVKFRKKCTTCGFEDSSWNTMRIINGLTRVPFFCPKCRRKRDVEIQGFPK